MISAKFIAGVALAACASVSFAAPAPQNAAQYEKAIKNACAKMQKSVYGKSDDGTVTRTGCDLKNKNYIVIYEVAGSDSFKKKFASASDQKIPKDEIKNYCTSYEWLVRMPAVADMMTVEYRDKDSKQKLVSKSFKFSECR